ncbi:MAG: DNA topoisomerase IV subunit A [Clostridiaceae bacterium]|nr:DNA topoisomerase IV subunit A [Clostridiaceae bacterium]
MAKKIDIPKDNNIIKVPIEEAMPDNYLPYAVEVAKDRALPDVRDGLKPVHRRILFGAYQLKAFPDKPYFKSARIVGDILGKYHPHGDASVYDAMVILAQDFSTRKPLIDGHGNWGSIDGDNAAAMRYTEARLTPIALELLKDLDKDVVDMVENYSASELEPKVLPARYPNLLVNGVFGIAVGLATNIPPHNLIEVIDGTLAFIDNKDITTAQLMEYIKGPDLPTGGSIIGKNALISAYETGEGKVTLRSKANIERLESGRIGIVITEFPYRRNKAKLLQFMSEMTDDKRHAKALEAITDIRDESDRNGIRAVIELRKSATEDSAEKILKYLYKKTELQCNVSFNMVAIADGKPATLGLKAILYHYINHQKEVVTRRTRKELASAEKRYHIVAGFIKAIDILDEIIVTIRASKSKKDSENNLCEKFGFTGPQAEAIVELMLYRLTGLEIKVFEKEYKELEKLIKALKKILDSQEELLKIIKMELNEVKEKYGDPRRTVIVENDEEAKIDIEELMVIEDTMVTMSNEGYIKRVPLKSYNRSNTNVEDIEYREGDFNKYLFQSNTIDKIMFFTDKGNMYNIKAALISELKWKEKGEKIDSIIRGLDLSKEKIIAVHSIASSALKREFILFTSNGNIKKCGLDKFITNYSKIMALKLRGNEKLMDVKFVPDERERGFLRIQTSTGLEFSLEEPELMDIDRNTIGTQLFNINEMNEIINIEYISEYQFKSYVLKISKGGEISSCDVSKFNAGRETVIQTNSMCKILVFSSSGKVYNIPAFILENLKDKIELSNLVDVFDNNATIIGAVSVVNTDEDLSIYFVSKKGLIKRSVLSEFAGEYSSTIGYKLKSDNDQLISVLFGDNLSEKDLLVITKKAMCIRFESKDVSYMGKIASGVTGISLQEDDEASFVVLVDKENELKKSTKKIVLLSNKALKQEFVLSDIKVQNRAGRGKNLMLVATDDAIKEIKLR